MRSLLVMSMTALHAHALILPGHAPPQFQHSLRMSALPPSGSSVLVVGSGAIHVLAARISALRGYETTLALAPREMDTAKELLYDAKYPEGSLPITTLPIVGEQAIASDIEKAVANAEGLIIAFDSDRQFLPESALNIFLPPNGGTKIAHVSLMSRYLNGEGMGFFANAAKAASNAEIWAGSKDSVAEYRMMEAMVRTRVSELGASCTVIRAGTLKGGASGDTLTQPPEEAGGEPTFLNPAFYRYGQQDVSNWRLIFDCNALGVELVKGDTLPGPGFTAALTATNECGSGDSHRGAIATALVESLRTPAAADSDFSVKSTKGRSFPQEDAWGGLFQTS